MSGWILAAVDSTRTCMADCAKSRWKSMERSSDDGGYVRALKMITMAGMIDVFSPKIFDQALLYELAPTASATRAIDEKVYAERPHIAKSSARAGMMAIGAPLNEATPAASARTPEPTIFFARFTVVVGTLAPVTAADDEASARSDGSSIALASADILGPERP
eukprot:6198625-Pleurochrysis_carterae.AAC.2